VYLVSSATQCRQQGPPIRRSAQGTNFLLGIPHSTTPGWRRSCRLIIRMCLACFLGRRARPSLCWRTRHKLNYPKTQSRFATSRLTTARLGPYIFPNTDLPGYPLPGHHEEMGIGDLGMVMVMRIRMGMGRRLEDFSAYDGSFAGCLSVHTCRAKVKVMCMNKTNCSFSLRFITLRLCFGQFLNLAASS